MANMTVTGEEEQTRSWIDSERQHTDAVAADLSRHVAQLIARAPGSGPSLLLPISTREVVSSDASTVVMATLRQDNQPAQPGAEQKPVLFAEMRAGMPLIVVSRWIYAVFVSSLLGSAVLLAMHRLMGGTGWPALLPVLTLNVSWGIWLHTLLSRLHAQQQKPMRWRDLFFLHHGLLELSLLLGRQASARGYIVNVPGAMIIVASLSSLGWLLFSTMILGIHSGPLGSEPLTLLTALHLGVMSLWGTVMWRYERAQRKLR